MNEYKNAKVKIGNHGILIYLLILNGNKGNTIECDSREIKDRLVDELRDRGNTVDVRNESPILVSWKKEKNSGD